MTVFDQVMQLLSQGYSDVQITELLRENGVMPQEIQDALNQARIKSAVAPMDLANQPPAPPSPEPQMMPPQITEERPQDMQPPAPEPQQVPQQDPYAQQQMPQQPQTDQQYYQQTPQAYTGQEYYMPGGQPSTETIAEVAEQIAKEKIEEYEKRVGDVVGSTKEMKDAVEDLTERIKRIETTLDKLQQAIIGKVGEFGENAKNIHKDIDNLHGTVSKLMNPLIDNLNELKKSHKKK